MKSSKKIAWLALALALVTVVTFGLVWVETHHAAPQIIILPNGERYRFAGVTYGTNNIPPSFLARLVHRLPDRLAGIARKALGARITQYNQPRKFDYPMLFVWLERLGTNTPSGSLELTVSLADENGVERNSYDGAFWFNNANIWSCASFRYIPRRSKTLQLNLHRVYNLLGADGPPGPIGHFSFPNPLYGRFPQWQPEPVPITKSNAFFSVRLDEFSLDNFVATLHAPAGIRNYWMLARTELSDATGNVFQNIQNSKVTANYRGNITEPTGWFSFSQPTGVTPWPGEAAWRLKLVFQRASGFNTNELVTFKNVPVPGMGATNTLNLTNSAGGIQVVLTTLSRQPNTVRANSTTGGWANLYTQIVVEPPGDPADMALDMFDATTDAGKPQHFSDSRLKSNSFLLVIPANAKTMNLTFVLQKTRTVEFLVQPPQSPSSK